MRKIHESYTKNKMREAISVFLIAIMCPFWHVTSILQLFLYQSDEDMRAIKIFARDFSPKLIKVTLGQRDYFFVPSLINRISLVTHGYAWRRCSLRKNIIKNHNSHNYTWTCLCYKLQSDVRSLVSLSHPFEGRKQF